MKTTIKVDYALILAAGFGTRMGVIGETLPKVIWPVFEKSLLELQILFLKNLGIKKIFINLHHQKEEIQKLISHTDVYKDIEFKIEEEILGTGGPFYRIARELDYKGRLLTLTSDQFFFNDKDKSFLSWIDESDIHLLANRISFDGPYKYNEIVLDKESKLIDINKDVNKSENYITYSGVSCINLSCLERDREGTSSFFTTVADYKNKDVYVSELENLNHIEMGTFDCFYDGLFKVLDDYISGKNSKFLNFLINSKAFDPKKVNKKQRSYGPGKGEGFINLTLNEFEFTNGAVLLNNESSDRNVYDNKGIFFKRIFEKRNQDH